MIEPSTVLLAIADVGEWAGVMAELEQVCGYRVLTATSAKDALAIANDAHVDLVICEADLSDGEGACVLSEFRLKHADVIRILVKSSDGIHNCDNGTRSIAVYQYIRKPLDPEQVGLLTKRALEARELARRHRLLSRELKFTDDWPPLEGPRPLRHGVQCHNFEKLVYASEAMAKLCNLARQAAPTDLPILIQGETGTGKELFARAIHFKSRRHQSPLLFQNCGGMPDELLHSELFGHKRGAFTGAISDRLGLFRAADGGTVFLDEISDVSPAFQVSLLRFLQDGEIKPLGSDTTQTADVRILVASNVPLERLVREGKFRQDLYFRLKGFEINIPPLRERPDDIPVLVEFFTRKYCELMGRRVLGVANDVLQHLLAYPFPGNVRELENEIRRMVALTPDGGYVTRDLLTPEIAAAEPNPISQLAAGTPSLEGATLKDKVESLERALVRDALRRHRWNQSEAARELGLSRVGLANKIRRYNIEKQL